MLSHEIDDLESLASNDAPLHTVYSGTRSESVLAARCPILAGWRGTPLKENWEK